MVQRRSQTPSCHGDHAFALPRNRPMRILRPVIGAQALLVLTREGQWSAAPPRRPSKRCAVCRDRGKSSTTSHWDIVAPLSTQKAAHGMRAPEGYHPIILGEPSGRTQMLWTSQSHRTERVEHHGYPDASNHYYSCSPPWRRRLVRPRALVLGGSGSQYQAA